MKNFYIIGNGFDLYHGLDTHYRTFGIFLKNNYAIIYDQLLEFFGLPDISESDDSVDPLWRDFENSLSLLDSATVFEEYSDSLASPGAADFRDRDWNTFATNIEMVVDNLTGNLLSAFRKFIQAVKFPDLKPFNRLSLDADAIYLSFNYTDTLERYYAVPQRSILYIHGKAGHDDELILGHGIDPQNFEEHPQRPPEGLSSEDLERWQEWMADQYDYSFELGKGALSRYFLKSFKDTNTLISQYADYFDNLADIDVVYILGHSLSEVDLPYIDKVIGSLNNNAKFFVSYYSDTERASHVETLLKLGIEFNKFKMIRMSDLISSDV